MAARQLASLSAVDLTAALPHFMSNAVCDLFQNCDINSPPKDEVVFQNLINPLQWMLFGGDPAVALSSFEIQNTHSNFCGKVFKSGEPAYFCKYVSYRCWWSIIGVQLGKGSHFIPISGIARQTQHVVFVWSVLSTVNIRITSIE